MADFRIKLGVDVETKDISSTLNSYKAKPIEVKTKLDTSGIDTKIRGYKAPKQIEVTAKLNSKKIDEKIKTYTAPKQIELSAKLNTKDIDSKIKSYQATSPIVVDVKLNSKNINEQIKAYQTSNSIEVGVKLKDDAINKAISGYQTKTPIKVDLDLNYADVDKKVSQYEVRSPLRVKVKINKTDINQQISQCETDKFITVNAKLNNGAISEAIRNYKTTTPIKVDLTLDHSDIDKKVKAYTAGNPVNLTARIKLNAKDIASQLQQHKITVPVEIVVAKLDATDIDKKIGSYKPSHPITVGVKLDDKAIGGQIKGFKTNTPIEVEAKLKNDSINQAIAKFKPSVPIEVDVKIKDEDIDKQINSYKAKAPIDVDVRLSESNIEDGIKNQKIEPPIKVGVKLDSENINEQIKGFKTNAKVKVGVKLDFASHKDDTGKEIQKGVSKQLKEFETKSKIKVGVELDKDGITQEVNNINVDTPIRLGVELDPNGVQNVQNQVDNLRQQLEALGNANININGIGGGAGNNGGTGNGGNGRGGRRQVDETTQAYRELMGVLGELNSKRLQLNGLDASSPESSNKIQRLRLQIEQLENEYDNLMRSFTAQGIQFTADQWNELETIIARVGRQIDVVQAGMSDKSAINQQTQAYKDLLSISKEISSLELNIAKLSNQGGSSNQIAELENQLNTLRMAYQQLVTSMDIPLTSEQWSSLNLQIAQTQDKIAALQAKFEDTKESLAGKIELKLNDGTFDNDVSNITSKFEGLRNKSDEIKVAMNEVNAALRRMQTASNAGDIDGLIEANQQYERALKAVKNQLDINTRAEKDNAASQKLADQRSEFMSSIDAWLTKNSAAVDRFGSAMLELKAQAESCDKVTLDHLKTQFKQLDAEADAAGLKMQSFGDRIKAQFKKYSAYFGVAELFMYAEQGLRDMFQQVVAIDTAMTELKKVTNETDASYDKFLSNAANRAKEIGTTIDGLVTSTADFARLGYSFEESAGLAEVANIYTVVGDEIEGVEDATQSLVSTLAAFKHEMGDMSDSEFAMSIVDKMNEVSNNFAISSGGIGEALQRSASSMAAANNTLDETIAMITAANEVAQNPEKVGNAMKTISMRIRGAKTELEEAGESTDGMAESTASLREEMLALSGVDIMLDPNTFKSTYQIMDELSQKWEGLSDIAQATIIELVAGKHQGNIMSSLMANFDTARAALETSANSSGSAMAEHAKWSESLEARLNKLKATWQSLAQSFMSSDFLKGAVSALTGFVDVIDTIVDKLGTLPTLLSAFAIFKSLTGSGIFKTIKDEATGVATGITNVFSQAAKKAGDTFKNIGLKTESPFSVQLEKDKQALSAYSKISEELRHIGQSVPKDVFKDIFEGTTNSAQEWVKNGKLATEGIESFVEAQKQTQVSSLAQNKSLSTASAIIKEYFSGCQNVGMSQEKFAEAVAKTNPKLAANMTSANSASGALLGYGISAAGAAAKSFILSAAVSALNMAFNTLLTMGITALISWGIKKFDEWYVSADELAEKVDEVTTKYKDQHNELLKLKGDYDTSDEDSMISKYGELSKGVGSLGENISLTAEEYAEYQSIVDKIASQNPKYVAGYNAQGKAILKNAGDVDKLAESYRDLIRAENEEIIGPKGAGRDILKDFENDLRDTSAYYTKQIKGDYNQDIIEENFDLKHLDKLEQLMNLSGEELDKALSRLTTTDVERLSNLLEEQGIERNLFGSGEAGWETKREHIVRALKKDRAEIKSVLDGAKADFDKYAEEMGTITDAYFSDAFLGDYAHMSEKMQSVISQTASGFGADFYAQFLGKENGYELLTDSLNSILSAFNSMSDTDAAQFEAAFDLKTQFNGGEISYGEYVSNLQEAGKLVDRLGLDDEIENQIKLSLGLNEEGFVDQYETLLNRLKETNKEEIATGNIIGLGETEAEKLLDGLSAQELSVLTKIIPEIDANATREQIEAAIDREMVLSGLIFDLNLEVEAAGIESLNTALSESVTASGLSSESISALKSRYADLEKQGWDLSSMFEETSHGIHVNRNELSKFENALSTQKLAEIDSDLTKMKSAYDDLGEAIKNCKDPIEKSKLFDQRQSLGQKISEAATLAHQYKGLASAYNQWLAAEEAGNERDMYENVINGLETVKDELSRGWADDSTIAFLEMLTGRTDLAGKSGKELKEVYDGLGKTIENTKYSVKDFFTTDKDGNSTSKGVYNFLDAVGQLEEEKFGYKDIVKRDGKGNVIGFDFELAGGDEVIAEALGVSEELVQIMVRAADDAGFVVSMDGTYRQLADLQNEARASVDVINELFGTEYTFDFNTNSLDSLEKDLEKAKKILDKTDKDGNKLFWNDDGTYNFDAKGATEAMQIVSTLQAKLDTVSQEKYGIGLTVEDKQFEEPLEKLQDYGHKVAELNQLKLNPKANEKEISKLEGELDTIAQDLIDISKNNNIDIGIDADDNVEDVKDKIAKGEVKIPTTLDIQTSMDKGIKDLVTLSMLQSGLIDEETAKIRLGIEIEPKVTNPEAVGEEVANIPESTLPTPTIETPVELKPTSQVQADKFLEENGIVPSGQLEGRFGIVLNPEVKNPEAVKEEIDEVTGGKNGTATEPVTVAQPVELDLSVKEYQEVLQDLKDADKEVTIDVTTNGLDDVIKLEESIGNINENINLSADIEGNVDSLTKFADGAKTLEEIDSNIAVYVTADIEGNVLETAEKKIDNLKIFAEGAKEIQGIDSKYITVDASVSGNVLETAEKKLDNLKTFAEGAKELNGVESNYVSIDANVGGNVVDTADEKIKNVKSFAEAANELKNAKNVNISVVANVSGSALDSTEDKLENLKEFADGAKALQGIKNVDSSVKVNLEGNLNDGKTLENLAQFADGAKALQGIKNSEVTITANLNGNFLEKTKDKIDNLGAFAESAKAIQGVKGTDVSVTANLNGNFLEKTEDKLENLKTFADGANALKDAGDKEVSITASANGNAFDKDSGDLNKIKIFAKGAKELQGVESAEASITANIKGNIATWTGNFSDLGKFAAAAKELQGTKSSSVSVTANVDGDISEGTASTLERFADAVNSLPTGASTISVKASIDTANINSAIGLLEGVANSGLFKDYNANVTVTYQKVSDEVDGYNPLDLTRKVTYNLDASEVYAFNPPNLHRTVTYTVVYAGGGAAEGGHMLNNGTYHNEGGGRMPVDFVDGTAHVDGTVGSGRAFKRGDWRTKDSGIALMGELGRK